MLKYNVEYVILIVFFDGVVVNLFLKFYNLVSILDVFCMVIDMQGMEVDFIVFESELLLIKNGDKVVIKFYLDVVIVYEGSILEINFLVDDKGMVKVKVWVNGVGKLFSGMNVCVSVYCLLGEQLVILKSVVVFCLGKQVVFILKDGKMV